MYACLSSQKQPISNPSRRSCSALTAAARTPHFARNRCHPSTLACAKEPVQPTPQGLSTLLQQPGMCVAYIAHIAAHVGHLQAGEAVVSRMIELGLFTLVTEAATLILPALSNPNFNGMAEEVSSIVEANVGLKKLLSYAITNDK